MTTKPIDLGALQEELRNANALVRAITRTVEASQKRYNDAITVMERDIQRLQAAEKHRECSKRALIEGARQVANG